MKRAYWIGGGALGVVALAAFGCGGIDGGIDGLFNGGSGGSGSGGAPATTVTSGDPATTTSSTTSATTGETSSASASVSSSESASASVSASASSSSGGPVMTVDCGGVMCPLGNQNACCWDHFNTNPPPQGSCVQGSIDNDNCKTYVANDGLETRIECEKPSQCAQGVCCAHRTFYNGNSSFYDLVSCADTCAQPNVTLCDMQDPVNTCPMVNTMQGPVQYVCKTSVLLPPGYFVCGNPG